MLLLKHASVRPVLSRVGSPGRLLDTAAAASLCSLDRVLVDIIVDARVCPTRAEQRRLAWLPARHRRRSFALLPRPCLC
jgi:hypothetical protein